MKHSIRLLVIALAGVASPSNAADVGRVLLAAGDTIAVRGNQSITLAFGAVVQDRDVLRTGSASNLQVRFVDESIVSMREMSELRIDEFRFAGKEDGSERALFSLLKGGLRVITGLVGRFNNTNYRMSTPTATIGIRGTDYAARLCQKDCSASDGTLARDGLYGRVLGPSHGTNRIDVANDADRKAFGINENFYVADRKSPIEALLVPPDFVSSRLEGRKRGGTGTAGGSGIEQTASGGAQQDSRSSPLTPPPLEPLVFVSTENLGTDGNPAVLAGSLPSIGNGGIVYIVGFVSLVPLTNAILTPNSANQLSAFSMGSPTGMLTGTVVDSGSSLAAGNLHWGRWTSGIVDTSPVSNLHYIVGDVSTVATLPGTGTFIYTPVGGTAPTNAAGLTGSFLGGTVFVDFGKGTLQPNSWQIVFNGATYSTPLVGPIATFAGSPSIPSTNLPWTCVGACSGLPGTVISGNFSGSFVGANAPGMGMVYLVQDSSAGNGNITGAQGFKR
jgi:hypothetical protein